MSSIVPTLLSLGTLPCEIDQAKLDLFSRLARSTNLSKILEGGPPERNPWIESPDRSPDVLELDALACT